MVLFQYQNCDEDKVQLQLTFFRAWSLFILLIPFASKKLTDFLNPLATRISQFY